MTTSNKKYNHYHRQYDKRPKIKWQMQQPKKIDAYSEYIKKIIKRGVICQKNQML